MKSSLIAFVKKEFIHISRDKRTMMILLLMPVILIILFGYAITTEIKRVPVAILDQSRGTSFLYPSLTKTVECNKWTTKW